jgi:hypothetical protein
MTNPDTYLGFTGGYANAQPQSRGVEKTAGIPEAITKILETGVTASSEILPYLLALPAVVGGFGGAIHSKITSPSKLDFKTVQKAIELADIRKLEADLARNKTQAELEEEAKQGGSDARSLRI